MILYKLAIIIFLFVISFTFGYLPIKVSYFTTNYKLLGISNAFSGGIFLCVAMLHLLPESTEIFDNMLTKEDHDEEEGHHHSNRFPISFLIAVLGYSLILFIEKIIFDHGNHEHQDAADEEEDKDIVDEMDNRKILESNLVKRDFTVQPSFQMNRPNKSKISMKINSNISDTLTSPSASNLSKSKHVRINEYLETFKVSNNNEEQFKQLFSNAGKISFMIRDKITKKEIGNKSGSSEIRENLTSPNKSKHPLAHESAVNNTTTLLNSNEKKPEANVSSYLLLIALSVHAVFEGIAIGLQDNTGEMFYMFLAISFHKWVEALSIGINLSKSNIEKSDLFNYILVFSIMTPGGILCGVIFSGISNVIEAFFLSISAGNKII